MRGRRGMTLSGIKDAVWRTAEDILQKHTFQMAAALAYYFVLAIFPALILLSAVIAYVPVQNLFNQVLGLLGSFVPPDSMQVVQAVLANVVTPNRGTLLSFGILGIVWTASGGFASAIEALNIAYEVEEGRPFWVTRPLAVGLTFMVGLLLLIALAVMIAGPHFGQSRMALHTLGHLIRIHCPCRGVCLLRRAQRQAAILEHASRRHSFRRELGWPFLRIGRLLSQLRAFQQDLRHHRRGRRANGLAVLEWICHAGRRTVELPACQRVKERQNPTG
jgi:Virulence factor BrkB